MTPMQKLDDAGAHGGPELRLGGADGAGGATGPDERMAALFRRHGSDHEFRAAVDDMTAATGLALSDTSLGPYLDEVLHLARYKRAQASLEAPSH